MLCSLCTMMQPSFPATSLIRARNVLHPDYSLLNPGLVSLPLDPLSTYKAIQNMAATTVLSRNLLYWLPLCCRIGGKFFGLVSKVLLYLPSLTTRSVHLALH